MVGSNSGRSVPAAHQQDKLYTRRDCHPGVWSRCLGFQRHHVVFFFLVFAASGLRSVAALFRRDSSPVPLRVLQLCVELHRRQGKVGGACLPLPSTFSLTESRAYGKRRTRGVVRTDHMTEPFHPSYRIIAVEEVRWLVFVSRMYFNVIRKGSTAQQGTARIFKPEPLRHGCLANVCRCRETAVLRIFRKSIRP